MSKKIITELSEGEKNEGSVKFCLRDSSDGTLIYYEARLIRAFSHTYNKHIIAGTLKDITIEVNAEQQLMEMYDKAEASSRLKSAFLENISHEIRTPLNAIVGFTQVIHNRESDDVCAEERDMLLDLIQVNTELLTTLVNDVLDISLLESEKYSFVFEEISLTEACSNALNSIMPRMPKGVTPILDFPPETRDETFYTDKVRLQQVLGNFLTNACKYTESGSITLGYKHGANGAIDFFVTDTGCGIVADKAEIIFERFEKLDSFKQGAGLGLSVCRIIANLINGKVYLDTTYDKGSRFVFTHPHIAP
ncbi:MAG: sensor histidine kinase [Phocaeicola sp.]